jgi:hypothetical protein
MRLPAGVPQALALLRIGTARYAPARTAFRREIA